MPDDLDVSGGTTGVSTDDLEIAADQLGRLAREASALAAELSRLDPPGLRSSPHVDQARVDIDVAVAQVRWVASRSALLHALLLTAGRGYVLTERAVGTAIRWYEATAARGLGDIAPALLAGSGAAGAFGVGTWLGIRAAGGLDGIMNKLFEKNGIPSASSVVKQHNSLLNNSVTAAGVRALAQGAGPFLMGVAGAPPGAPQLLGARSYQIGARGLVGLGQTLDLFEETGVKLVETTRLPGGAPPTDYVDRLARVPYEEDGSGPQVRIEKYTAAGEPDRYCVYITGTATFSPVATDQPWDLTSNLVNAAGGESGSFRAVQLAMEAAGIDASSPVQFTGYSQGGGTAASLASSGLYNTQGLTTFGGPTGQIPIPEGFPTVLVEHSDDLVPALGGEQSNVGAVLVRRDVFGGENLPQDWAVPSHHYEYYVQTARLMDESGSPRLDQAMRELDAFTAGATMESSSAYRFERTEG